MAGQVVVITGCDSGFGRETALKLAKDGYRVFAGCYTEDGENKLARDAQAILEEIRQSSKQKFHGALATHRLDVTKDSSVETFKEAVERDAPNGIYCLVNNAGVLEVGPGELVPVSVHAQVFAVNYFGPLRMMQAFLPLLRRYAQKNPTPFMYSFLPSFLTPLAFRPPRVVNISSMAGRVICPGLSAYSASKHAIKALTDSMRIEIASMGVKVTCIEPFFASTPMVVGAPFKRSMENYVMARQLEVRKAYEGLIVGKKALEGTKDADVGKELVNRFAKRWELIGSSWLGSLKPRRVVDAMALAVKTARPL
ncbi:Retinol dehydrogenase 5 [Phlyctochytrium planicorne]|nr:Retinol dehydrogenase 5 [Phlyctochytrium planicorne]